MTTQVITYYFVVFQRTRLSTLLLLQATLLGLVISVAADPEADHGFGGPGINHNHYHFTGAARNGAYGNPYGAYPGYGYPGGYPGGYGGYGGYPSPYGYPNPYGTPTPIRVSLNFLFLLSKPYR
jgi:hypothetical protein